MKRKDNESFENYKNRRKKANLIIKMMLRGNLFWDSSKKGTYRKYT